MRSEKAILDEMKKGMECTRGKKDVFDNSGGYWKFDKGV